MDTPQLIYALRWLIKDTFRQAMANRAFWILLGLSALGIFFCLGVSVEGGAVREEGELWTAEGELLEGPTQTGRLTLMYGLFPVTFSREAREQVHLLLSIFASWVAGTLGILMALIWTASFLPESLQPGTAAVLLAKPTPRWLILTGKYIGVVGFIALHATIFFVGTWVALGIRTNTWEPLYLLGIPMMTLHFAVIFSVSVLLAVLFRNTMACVIGSIVFWIICYTINYAHAFSVVHSELNPGAAPLPGFTVFLTDVGYWLLPKPADLTVLFEQALALGEVKATLASQQPFEAVVRNGHLSPLGSIITSALFPVFAIWAAAAQLSKQDY